jgi:hypothetical protein
MEACDLTAKDHPLLSELVELADSIDMATMAAERGVDAALHAWLAEIRDDAAKLADQTHHAFYGADEQSPEE